MTPLKDKVLVKVAVVESVSKGGIILPDSSKEERTEGTIVGAGKDVVELLIGDIIVFGKYAGDDIEVNGEKFKILKENEVLLKL